MGKLKVSELRDLESQVSKGEISYSRMVEIINQKFEHAITDEQIKTFSTEAVTLDGSELDATKELIARAVQQGAEWSRWKITGLQSVPSTLTHEPSEPSEPSKERKEAVEFVEWLGQNVRPLAPNKNEWIFNNSPQRVTTSELYEIFKNK